MNDDDYDGDDLFENVVNEFDVDYCTTNRQSFDNKWIVGPDSRLRSATYVVNEIVENDALTIFVLRHYRNNITPQR